ncbi:PREDICTED: procollagen-lysine,2-oxoglutarate 5-dioxygenase 1 isoform X2 [Nicrophorus vespilloides]|uniref:Procollagen-lysine,2-oxoglutarate 5-dioxygenase 1 isoform X2 n=1 Tax=Nicrophorus vespilloides TaxID=110193 RepID=A0ABM1NAF8_NICVS|nr:PREDICTED: procollagen-lysine,2-oxoglutarate 5-dioxygenase 1 isoform X2 [Nicrophorus vespilloides]
MCSYYKFIILAVIFINIAESAIVNDEVLVYTVATEETDGFQRYLQTARQYGILPTVLGMGEEWKGGENIRQQAGGGWKVNLFRDALKKQTTEDDQDKIVLFTDGYDVIFLSKMQQILDAFKKTEARILFGAESACWPDQSLAKDYPQVTHGKPYLNSGLYMGYISDILQLLERETIEDAQDDQLFFTKAYLDETFRNKHKFKLDHNSEIFQNLNGATSEIEIYPDEGKESTNFIVKNFLTQTQPLILHGNGPSKIALNALANYAAQAWTPQEGCLHCKDGHMDFEDTADHKMPIVYLAVFVEQATPFLTEQLQKINSLHYPKKRMHIFIHNNLKYHQDLIKQFIDFHKNDYLSIKEVKSEDGINEWAARDLSLDQCLLKNCDFYFSIDGIAHLDNPHTLRLLIEQNRTIVAPLLVRPKKAWSNFWGALTTDGFYARSNDYMDIVHNTKRGLWNVPFITNCYLVNATLLRKYDRTKIHYSRGNLDADMAFCANIRDLDIFMYVSNRIDFGHLINPESFDTTLAVPDMYQIFDNQQDWEERYIHKEYPEAFNVEKKPKQPCPDVYWFPVVTRKFCNDLIQMMESFGKWSSGTNDDNRLQGGYEAVPTRDIHMNQVGWEPHWLYFLQQYIRPLQELVFTGYFHDPPRSMMNFVVRYRPDEQPSLRPHHDSSTYTINIALNEINVDYEGGGCKFLRYNCSVVDTKPGWVLIHPGRLTHFHEGLLVTKGTRYIMISFVDP